jgi:hypothetical protein
MRADKPAAFFVITRYKEDYSWVDEYTDDYIIYNKGEPIYDNPKIINTENWGYNERDIPMFVYEHYEKLPELTAFLQGDPFAQCKKDVFDDLIYNTTFTRLEAKYPELSDRSHETGYYIEPNYNKNFGADTSGTVDNFLLTYFLDYTHIDTFTFTPGAQYIVEKERLLQYPKKFWYKLMNDKLNTPTAVQAHILERAIIYIFTGNYKLREEFYDE